jgi:hypothetical protein
MWTKAFWQTTFERVIRASAAAMAGTYVIGDQITDNIQFNWEKALTVGYSTAAVTLLLCLAGNAITKSGPSFNQTETVDPVAPVPPQPPVA